MLTAHVGRPDSHALAVRHLPLVKAMTIAARRRLPRAFDAEDLFGAGTIGLVEAGHLFDPTCGVTFGQFARTLVSRAIADHVREGTAANRQHRRDTRAGRAPLDCLEVPVAAATQVPAVHTSPEDAAIAAERQALIRAAVDELPRRLRAVIVHYYFKDESYRVVGKALKTRRTARGYANGVRRQVSKSQVKALHAQALAALRDALARRGLTAECFT